MKRRKRRIIVEESSSTSNDDNDDEEDDDVEEEEKESQIKLLPKGFFDSDSDSDEEEIVLEYDSFNSEIQEIGERIRNIPNFPLTPIFPGGDQKFESTQKYYKFAFSSPLFRIINSKLYYHQKIGVDFLWNNLIEKRQSVLIGDFMGLGKSLQVVSFVNMMMMNEKERKPVLLLCPKVVIKHWVSEFEVFNNWVIYDPVKLYDFKGQNPFLLKNTYGTELRTKIVMKWFETNGIIIMSYQKFVSLWSLGYKDINERILSPNILLVLDEGHKIKTDATISKTSRALSKSRTTQKIILTGYPLQNNLMEYWYMMTFLVPKYLGEKKKFKKQFLKPINKGIQEDASPSDETKSRKLSYILFKTLSPFMLRRGVDLLERSLNIRKYEYVIYVKMSKLQVLLYNCLIKFLRGRKNGNVLFWSYHFITLLCNHPDILKEYFRKKSLLREEESEEVVGRIDLEALEEKLNETYKRYNFEKTSISSSGKMPILFNIIYSSKKAKDKLVIFTKSILSLDFIQGMIQSSNSENREFTISLIRMDGSLETDKRQAFIDLFNAKNSSIDVLLISTLACCEGINLHSANRVVLLDVNWNPSNDVEAMSRVYRFGQKKNVVIYRLVTYGTIENKVHQRQLQKQKLLGLICDNQNMSLTNILSSDELLKEMPQYQEYVTTLCDLFIDHSAFGDSVLRHCVIPHCREMIASIRSQDVLLSEIKAKSNGERVINEREIDRMISKFKEEGFFNLIDFREMEKMNNVYEEIQNPTPSDVVDDKILFNEDPMNATEVPFHRGDFYEDDIQLIAPGRPQNQNANYIDRNKIVKEEDNLRIRLNRFKKRPNKIKIPNRRDGKVVISPLFDPRIFEKNIEKEDDEKNENKEINEIDERDLKTRVDLSLIGHGAFFKGGNGNMVYRKFDNSSIFERKKRRKDNEYYNQTRISNPNHPPHRHKVWVNRNYGNYNNNNNLTGNRGYNHQHQHQHQNLPPPPPPPLYQSHPQQQRRRKNTSQSRSHPKQQPRRKKKIVDNDNFKRDRKRKRNLDKLKRIKNKRRKRS